MRDGDQLIVVGDGERSVARKIMAARPGWNVFYLETPFAGDFGSTPIDYGTQIARGDFICYLGDDDEIADGAMRAIREQVVAEPVGPHLFAMIHENGRVLRRDLRESAVSGQQLVVPNDAKRLPRYASDKPGEKVNDYRFLMAVQAAWPEAGIRCHDAIIARLDKMNQGRIF